MLASEKIKLMAYRLGKAKTELPKLLANLGQNYFSREFQKSEWDGKPWEARKKQTGKHLLVKTGRLRRAVFHSVRRYNWREIVWGTGPEVPYAKVHNEGLQAGRGKGFMMPKRTFMADSPELRRKIKERIQKDLKNILK